MHPGRTPFVATLAIWDLVAGLFKLLAAAFLVVFSEGGAGTLVALLCALWGLLSLAAGQGMWRLRAWGRSLQMLLAVLGLPLLPFGTVLGVVTLVGLTRPQIRDLFGGDAVGWTKESAHQARKVSGTALAWFGGVAALSLGALPFLGIISAIAIPNFLNAADRGRQKRTMAEIRTVATAVEAHAIEHEVYPVAGSFDELVAQLDASVSESLPRRDGWGHLLAAESRPERYVIVSAGKDGMFEEDSLWAYTEEQGSSSDYVADIAYSNGSFHRWPEGIQR